MSGLITIDDREYDFSQSYLFLLELFKTIDAKRKGIRVKHIRKDELIGEELETFTYLAMDLSHTGLKEMAVHLALVNSKYAAKFMEEESVSQVTASVTLATHIRVTFKANPRLIYRAEEQIKRECKK